MQQLGVVIEVFSKRCKGCNVFWKTGTTPAQPDVEIARTDSFVQAHTLGDELGVGADTLADPRDLVDERDAGRQKRVRRVLDHLRGVDIWSDQDRRLERRVQHRDLLCRVAVVAAHDDTVRVHEVLDG